MTSRHLEFLVEELSMQAFLEGLLGRILPEGSAFDVIPFEGKQDMLEGLENRLRGYKYWPVDSFRLIVLMDCDSDNCHELKSELESIAKGAGLRSKSTSTDCSWQVANRIVIPELEAWYFGDWTVVCRAYSRVPSNIPRKSKYRNPDAIRGGAWEAFERILKENGHSRHTQSKIKVAKDISAHIDPDRNTSSSFQAFYRALTAATQC